MAQYSGYMYMYRSPISDSEFRKQFVPASSSSSSPNNVDGDKDDSIIISAASAESKAAALSPSIPARTNPSLEGEGLRPRAAPQSPQSPPQSATAPPSTLTTSRFGRFRHKRSSSGDTSGRKSKDLDQERRSRFFRGRTRDSSRPPTGTTTTLSPSSRFLAPSSSVSLSSSSSSAPGLFQQALLGLTSHSRGKSSSDGRHGEEPQSQDPQSQDPQSHHKAPVFLPSSDHIVGSSSRPPTHLAAAAATPAGTQPGPAPAPTPGSLLPSPTAHPPSLSPLHLLSSSSNSLSRLSISSSSSLSSSPTIRSSSPSVSLRRSLTAGASTSKLARLTAAYVSDRAGAATSSIAGARDTGPATAASTSASNLDLTLTPAPPRNATMVFEPELGKLSKLAGPFGRSESVSSASATSLNYGTMATSSKPSSSHSRDMSSIAVRNGRAYLRDTTNVYPLPVDLQELHRQSLQLLLLIQVFGTPMISLDDADRPPRRILDVGCASGFWSMMCHRHLKAKGFENATFVGMDVAPLAPGSLNGSGKPDRDMNWRFVQHDIRQTPLPFADNEFDHIHIANMCMSTPDNSHQPLMEEYVRILRPGGTIEMWETDTTIRMLRPHVPESMTTDVDTDEDDSDSGDDANGHQYGSLPPMGVYNISASTPLSAPCNPFLVEYNGWVVRALESSRLTAVPCTIMGAMLLQETDVLRDVRSRRVAIPLSTVRWEREGVGGVVTKDGKSYVDWTGKSKSAGMPVESTAKVLSPSHLAIRHTALLSVVGLIQSLEPLLREHSGKSQDEWDIWYGKMTNDLLRGQGTTWGECMETGAWWCKKR